MAEEELDLDAKGSSKKKLIIMIVLVLALVGGSVGITLMLVGGDSTAEESEAEPEEVVQKPIYLPLEKIVSAFQQGGGARFVQIEMELMAYDQAALDAVQAHMPAIRNDLLRIIGTQTYEVLNSEAGKERLRGDIVTAIQAILTQQHYEGEGIQQVYITSFVMQ